jgi:hypothetical protein
MDLLVTAAFVNAPPGHTVVRSTSLSNPAFSNRFAIESHRIFANANFALSSQPSLTASQLMTQPSWNSSNLAANLPSPRRLSQVRLSQDLVSTSGSITGFIGLPQPMSPADLQQATDPASKQSEHDSPHHTEL